MWIFSNLKYERFKYVLPNGGRFGGLPVLAQMLGVPFFLFLLDIKLQFWKLVFSLIFLSLSLSFLKCSIFYVILLRNIS